ncbi:unnamed protein product [Closterium sp. NIES-64]|nr:unnamed protein product [Closterium sp. NIES-64]
MVRSHELQRALATMTKGRSVCATIANVAFEDMLLNWWEHTRRCGIQNVLVGALDDYTMNVGDVREEGSGGKGRRVGGRGAEWGGGGAEWGEGARSGGKGRGVEGWGCTLGFLTQHHRIPSIRLHGVLPPGNFRSNATAFQGMGMLKTALVLAVLEAGSDVLLSDTDVVWLRDPHAYFYENADVAHADVFVTSDSLSHSNDVARYARPLPLFPSFPNSSPPPPPLNQQRNPSVMVGTDAQGCQQRNPSVMVGTDAQGWFRNATPRATEIFGNAYEHALNTGILFFRASPDSVALALTSPPSSPRLPPSPPSPPSPKPHTHPLSIPIRPSFPSLSPACLLLHHKLPTPTGSAVVSSPTTGRPISNRVFWAFSRRLKLALLPLVLFCNGHVFFEQQMPRRIGVTPYAVHSTFQFHYGAGKIGRFREAGLWALDPPEFYTRGNFLSFDVKLPVWIEAMPTGIDKHQATIEYAYNDTIKYAYVSRSHLYCSHLYRSHLYRSHLYRSHLYRSPFSLLLSHPSLAVTRKALAIARLLNRFLILPHVTCYCDRAPGGDIDPPFTCPIDLFINPMAWGSDPTTMVYRPASFLSFPQVPNEIRLSKAVVGVRYGSVSGEEASSRVPAAGEELFAKLPSDQLLRSEGEGVQKHGESVPGYSLEGGNRRVDFRNRGSVQDDRRELGKEEGRRIGGEQEERGSRSEGREKERVFLPANATDGEVQRSLGGLDSVRVLHLADAAHSFCRHVDADTCTNEVCMQGSSTYVCRGVVRCSRV